MATKTATTTKKTAASKTKTTFGEVMIVYTKSSSHWSALVQPSVVTIEGIKFIQGKNVTGKEGHRMEGRRMLIPLDHVASLVEFASEDELWSEPQPKHIRPPDEMTQSAVLTSHEQHGQPHPKQQQGGGHKQRHGRFRGKRRQGQGGYSDHQDWRK